MQCKDNLQEQLTQLIDQRNFLLRKYKQFFQRYHTIYFFGAGADGVLSAHLLADLLPGREVYFIDHSKSKHGREIYAGITCYGEERMYGCDSQSTIVIITSFRYVDMFYAELCRDGDFNSAGKLGSTYVCDSFVRVFNTEAETLFPGRWYEQQKNEILQAFSVFNDRQSQQLYLKLLQKRMQEAVVYVELWEADRYYPPEIRSRFKEQEVFLDAGCYSGDAIESFREVTKERFRGIYAFELDAANAERAKQYDFMQDRRVHLFAMGIGRENTQLRYMQTGTSASGLGRTSRHAALANAAVKSIDSMIVQGELEERFTFVKLNINGSEADALYGMKRMLQRDKPKLAVCCTNRFADLWQLPLLLRELVPEYQLTLHHHGDKLEGTVLYAFVDE